MADGTLNTNIYGGDGTGGDAASAQLNALMQTGAGGGAGTNFGALGSSAAGGIAGVLAAGLANNSVAMPDTSSLQSLINQTAMQQQGIAGNAAATEAQNTTNFGNTMNNALSTATQNTGSAANNFLTQLGQTTDLEGQNLTQALNQKVYGALPAQQRQIMENATATGGTQRGAVGANLNAAGQTAATNVATGNAAIAEQTLQAKQAGLTVVENATNTNIQNQLGISQQDAVAIYNSGNTEAIQMMNTLLGISSTQAQGLEGLDELQIESQLENDNSQIAGGNALSSAWSDSAGQIAGAVLGNGAGS